MDQRENRWRHFQIRHDSGMGKLDASFLQFLQEQNYLPQDLPNEASKIPIPRKVDTTPRLATWAEASAMLLWYDELANKREGKKGKQVARHIRGLMVYLVLVLFCGIRREEACQVTWDDIDFGGKLLKVLVEGAKRKKRRVVGCEENVWAWPILLKKTQRRASKLRQQFRQGQSKREAFGLQTAEVS